MVCRKAVLPEPASPVISIGPGYGSCRFKSTGKPSEAMPSSRASAGMGPISARTALRLGTAPALGLPEESGVDISAFSSVRACKARENCRLVVIRPPLIIRTHVLFYLHFLIRRQEDIS